MGLLTALFYLWVPYNGDDLAYQYIFHDHYSWPIDYFPRVFTHHWVYSNGRMADKLLIGALSGFPKLLVAIIIGISASGMLYFAGRLVKNRFWLALALCFLLPWWDITNTATAFNYVITAAIMLWGVGRLISDCGKHSFLWFQVFLMFVAMGMHEAAGLPVMIGITYAQHKHFIPRCNKVLFYSGWAGALFSILSPGNFIRLGAQTEPDDMLPLLLLKSVPVMLLLLLIIILRRKDVKALWRTDWSVFVIAAVVSCAFCAVSGIVGRSGWFATIFALIAFIKMIPHVRWQPLAYLLSLVYIGHLAWVVSIQYRMNAEFEQVLREYESSDDGTVDFTPTTYSDLPYAALLYRPISVPVPENEYEIACFDEFYGQDSKHLRYSAPMKPQWRPGMRPKPKTN